MPSDILPPRGTLEIVQEHSLASALKAELERLIFDGELKAGERVNESNLAAQFRTSRGPLREALRALGEQGLICFTRNKGAFVRSLSLEEADELYDVRAALDDEVGRKLAGKLTDEQAASLEKLLDAMDADIQTNHIRRYYANNLRFHELLVVYAGNRRLADIYGRIVKELHLFRFQGLFAGGAPSSNVEHRHILRAIQSGDTDAAGLALRSHVEAARIRMRNAVQPDTSQ